MKALSFVLLCAACGGSEMLAEGSITLRPNAVVDPMVLVPGTVAISSHGDGYVRRVLAGGRTEPASLFDAVTYARFAHAFTPEQIEATADIHEDLDVDVSGAVTFAPDVELAFEIDDVGLVSFDLALRGPIDATLATHLQQQSLGGWNGVETLEAKPVRVKAVIDGVPIILVTRAVTDFAVYAGGSPELVLTSESKARVQLDTRIHYDRRLGWSIADESARDVAQHMVGAAPRDASGHVIAVATTRFEIGIYDRLGAYVELSATSGAEAEQCVALGEATIAAAAGADANVLAPTSPMPSAMMFRELHPKLGEMQCR